MSADILPDVNPFALLHVTTRDSMTAIIDAAEDRSMFVDADACQNARATLTNPRRRIEAELGWFPGVAPGVARKASEARTIDEIDDLPLSGLAKANALVLVAQRQMPTSKAELQRLLEGVSEAADDARLDRVVQEINEDREIAGLPPIASEEVAAEAFQSQQISWRRGVITVLDQAPTIEMAEAMFNLVEKLEEDEDEYFPRFLHDIIDDYALRAKPFMTKEVATAERLIQKARELAPSRPDALPPLFDALTELLNTWHELTYPLQQSATIRGRRDEDSETLAFKLRDLSLFLYNEHNLLEESRLITEMVSKSFASLPKVASVMAKDGSDLDDLAQSAGARDAEIAYAADVGKFSKTRLAISRAGLEWQGKTTPLENVKVVTWGGVNKSVNGVPTGTEYLIWWSDGDVITRVNLTNQRIYESFVERLWKALAVQILNAMVEHLGKGREIRSGTAILKNDTVILRRKKLFGDEPAEYSWDDVTVHSQDGSFFINGPDGSKASASMSYRDSGNAHFIETMIRRAFSEGITRMSDAFR